MFKDKSLLNHILTSAPFARHKERAVADRVSSRATRNTFSMGRKKRKVEASEEASTSEGANSDSQPDAPAEVDTTNSTSEVWTVPVDPRRKQKEDGELKGKEASAEKSTTGDGEPTASSKYSMTSHSGQIVAEDIYVSDGSSSEDEGIEVVVTTSRMGMMRRGLYQSAVLPQANRQWIRQEAGAADKSALAIDGSAVGDGHQNKVEGTLDQIDAEAAAAAEEAALLAKLDPAQRAARLLAEKQRREAAAIIEARRIENEENASRDPTLFSKRTAFDIRFDQIDDKPWQRSGIGNSDHNPQHAEYFNYGLSEEDWLEYAEQQLLVRQELIDASRQKRPPDPNIVPVQIRPKDGTSSTSVSAATVPAPKAPLAEDQNDANDPSDKGNSDRITESSSGGDVAVPSAGPQSNNQNVVDAPAQLAPRKQEAASVPVGIGGAWGAGAVPGSMLAKLMEEALSGESKPNSNIAVRDKTSLDDQASKRNDDSRQLKDGEKEYRPANVVKKEHDSHPTKDVSDEFGEGRRDGRDDGYDSHLASTKHDDYSGRGGHGYWSQHRNPAAPEADYYGGGNWPPPTDAYYGAPHFPPPPAPPPPGSGYYGDRGGRGDGSYGYRGGRGGRGHYEGGGGDFYSESSHSGWKRPRDGDGDPRRRR
jgi:Fip1 motif